MRSVLFPRPQRRFGHPSPDNSPEMWPGLSHIDCRDIARWAQVEPAAIRRRLQNEPVLSSPVIPKTLAPDIAVAYLRHSRFAEWLRETGEDRVRERVSRGLAADRFGTVHIDLPDDAGPDCMPEMWPIAEKRVDLSNVLNWVRSPRLDAELRSLARLGKLDLTPSAMVLIVEALGTGRYRAWARQVGGEALRDRLVSVVANSYDLFDRLMEDDVIGIGEKVTVESAKRCLVGPCDPLRVPSSEPDCASSQAARDELEVSSHKPVLALIVGQDIESVEPVDHDISASGNDGNATTATPPSHEIESVEPVDHEIIASGHGNATTATPPESEGQSSSDRADTAVPHPLFSQGRPETRDPRNLDEHPLSKKLFPNGLGTDDECLEMAASIETLQRTSILITGVNCGSTPRDVVLDGRRARRAAVQAKLGDVDVVVFDDLTDEQQAELIIHANLASGMARRLDERQKAALEHHLLEQVGKHQGQRGAASSASKGNSQPKGEWPEVVAAELKLIDPATDTTPNAIRERDSIFYSPVSTEQLKASVVDGKISKKAAVAEVRKALQDPEVITLLKEAREKALPPDQLAEHPIIVAAKGHVHAAVEAILKGGKAKSQPKPKVSKESIAQGTTIEGVCEIANFLGRRVKVAIDGDKITITDLGEADNDASVYRPEKPTTRSSWIIDVAAEVDCLPGELRTLVKVGEVEHLDPVKCPGCGGSIFRLQGGCPKCDPVPDLGKIRHSAETAAVRRATEEEFQRRVADGSVQERAAREVEVNGVRRLIGPENAVRSVRSEAREWAHTQLSVVNPPSDVVVAIREAVAAAIEADPRTQFGNRIVNLSLPRTRICLTTPLGNLDVVLWEKASHRNGASTSNDRAAVDVFGEDVCYVNSRDAFSSRCAFRKNLGQALIQLLKPTNPNVEIIDRTILDGREAIEEWRSKQAELADLRDIFQYVTSEGEVSSETATQE